MLCIDTIHTLSYFKHACTAYFVAPLQMYTKHTLQWILCMRYPRVTMLSCYALKGLPNDICRISKSLQFILHGSADSVISNSRRRFETAYNVSTRSAAQMPSIAYTHYASALRVTEFSNAIEIHCTRVLRRA